MSQGLRLLSAIAEHGSTTTFRNIQPPHLVDREEQTVYQFMRRHFRRHGQLPSITTIEEETRIELPVVDEPVDYYVQEVINRHVYNRVRDEFSVLRTHVTNTDIEGMMQSAAVIRQVCTPYSSQQQELQTIAELSQSLLDDYDYNHSRPGISGIPTGWEYLDRVSGGWQNGDLIVFVARPSVGKTHNLINSARHAWMENKSILFVTMEMTLKQIAMRFAAQHSNINPDCIRKGKLSYWGRRKYSDALLSLDSANNFHLFAGNFKKTTEDVDILVQELNPDAVYIDGLYLMRPAKASSRAGRYESVAYVIDEIKQAALMRDRPFVTTTQFGRTAGKRGEQGSLESVGYTDAISTHATIAIGIKMGAVSQVPIVQQVESGDGEIASMIVGHKEIAPYRIMDIMKGREGETGTFATEFRFAPTRFGEIPIERATAGRAVENAQRPDVNYMLP
jgi:replicative DNA helicase